MIDTLAIIVIVGLAGARATRLWRDDKIAQMPRDFAEGWLLGWGEGKRMMGLRMWVLDLLECPWCLSAWVTGAFMVVIDSATSRSVDLPFLSWLAAWWVACAAYWLVELIADRDSLAWHERESKGLA